MGTEVMQRAIFHVPGQQTAASAVLVHQKIERQIFDEELGAVLDALLVERVQDGMTGPVGRSTGALRHLFSVFQGLAAKGPLIDQPILGA